MSPSSVQPQPPPPSDPDSGLTARMQTLFSGSIVVFFGLLLRTGLLLLFELIAARHLGPAGYGLFSLAFTVVVVTASLPVLGLQNSLRRFISLKLETRETELAHGLVLFGLIWPAALGSVLGAALFLAARPLGSALFGKPELAPLLQALALVVPLWSTRRLATVIFSGYKKPLFKVVLEDLLEPGLRVVAAVLVAAAGWGALRLGYGTLVAYVVVGAVAWGLVLKGKREVVGPQRGMRVPWRELLLFSSPLVVSELADLILAWANLLLIGVLNVELEVGLFRAASQPPMLASAILTSFAFIYLPTATELFVRGDRSGWKRANNAVARWTLSLAFPVGVVCLIFPQAVITIVFGEEYRAGALAMQLLGGTYLIHAACGFTGLNLVVAGHTKLQMIGTLLGLGANVGASLLWIPRYGAAGAAAAILVSVVFRNTYNLVWMRVLLGLCPFNARYFRILAAHLAATAVLAGGVFLLELPALAGLIVLGLLELPLAVLLGFRFGVFRSSDLEWIARFRSQGRDPNGR